MHVCVLPLVSLPYPQTLPEPYLFSQEFQAIVHNSQLPQFPRLTAQIYVTRGKATDPELDKDDPLLFVGKRPDFAAFFKTMTTAHPQKAVLTFACGPGLMVDTLAHFNSPLMYTL